MERVKIVGEIEIGGNRMKETEKEIKNIPEFKKKIEKSLTANVTELLEIIFAGVIILEGSDLHIEPEEAQVKLRIRIDGVLHDIMTLDLKTYQALLPRIKLLSGLKLNIVDRPQDGRFTVSIAGFFQPVSQGASSLVVEIRASALPSEHGESIVLRFLNPKNLIEMENLGLRKDLIEAFKREIKKPNGMMIVTGPTGAGKTTTLYAILKKIHKPEIKVITIEDPIEYHLEGISQTQVEPDKGYVFASGLRSIMRQDPDVILVGEIRDLETAEIACQAALTGHLVLSTLHTNDASGAVARLVDLGVKPASIAPSLNMVVAQRLIRKICQKCSQMTLFSPDELKKIKSGLTRVKKEILPPDFFKSPRQSKREDEQTRFKIPKAKGCQDCNFTGYKGRIGIFELFLVDDQMEKFILTNPSIAAIRELAIKKGMVLMKQDGLIKVLEGVTTLEEVERVAGE